MKLTIMQPYFFPYIGYYQLINISDYHIIYDDVNYIKGKWSNRNKIIISGLAKYFNISAVKLSPNKKYNEIILRPDNLWREKLCEKIRINYKKKTYFRDCFPYLEGAIMEDSETLVDINQNSITYVFDYLGIKNKIERSSETFTDENRELSAQTRVLDCCKTIGADEYINVGGGVSLYSKKDFEDSGIDLKFIRVKNNRIKYEQGTDSFIENLSIIDVLVNNPKDKVIEFLNEYELF